MTIFFPKNSSYQWTGEGHLDEPQPFPTINHFHAENRLSRKSAFRRKTLSGQGVYAYFGLVKAVRKYFSINIIFWVCYFLYEWLANYALNNDYCRYFMQACLYVTLAFMTAYFTQRVIIGMYLKSGSNLKAWISFGLSVIFFTLLHRACTFYIIYRLYYPDAYRNMSWWRTPKTIIEGVWLYLIVGCYTLLYFMKAWYEQQRISEVLKKDKAVAQLELLKSQVHPHFIFNTLNNIYALSLHQDPRTPDLIHRLSSLLSYMLYEGKEPYIPISKEVEYLGNYIELQKIRYSDRLDISVNQFGSLDNFDVTPLLLLPLLENSFKHGVSNRLEKCWIRMDLSRSEEWLVVKIENSRENDPVHNGRERDGLLPETSGIGLANVRRRLEILYAEQYEFKTLSEEHSFLAVLKIKNQRHAHKLSHSR